MNNLLNEAINIELYRSFSKLNSVSVCEHLPNKKTINFVYLPRWIDPSFSFRIQPREWHSIVQKYWRAMAYLSMTYSSLQSAPAFFKQLIENLES